MASTHTFTRMEILTRSLLLLSLLTTSHCIEDGGKPRVAPDASSASATPEVASSPAASNRSASSPAAVPAASDDDKHPLSTGPDDLHPTEAMATVNKTSPGDASSQNNHMMEMMRGQLLAAMGTMRPGSVYNSTSIERGMALLPCILPPSHTPGAIVWQRPSDGALMTSDGDVVGGERERLQVLRNVTSGENHLLIRYSRFPDDRGIWSCSRFDGARQRVSLMVLVPPRARELVLPSNISLIDITSEAWAFTCSAQYAFPPVTLSWLKVSGPVWEYDVTPTSYMTSPDQKIATSRKLILSPLNLGSVFVCMAEHPTFPEAVKNTTLYFSPPFAYAQPLKQMDPSAMKAKMAPAFAMEMGVKLSKLDVMVMTYMVMVVSMAILLVLCTFNKRSPCKLDVRLRPGYLPVATHDQCHVSSLPNGDHPSTNNKQDAAMRRSRWYCLFKALAAGTLLMILLLSLGVAFSVYMKGNTIPTLGTDVMSVVTAGSALWMDCSSLTLPHSSLLVVTWRKNFQRFYQQYIVQGQHVGIAPNLTYGFSIGPRVTSHNVGQVNVWPMLPDESGLYSCDVIAMQEDTGRALVKRKMFGVIVTTGPVTNTVLLAIMMTSLVVAMILAVMAAVHCVTCRKQKREPT